LKQRCLIWHSQAAEYGIRGAVDTGGMRLAAVLERARRQRTTGSAFANVVAPQQPRCSIHTQPG
jgi:hypothetical protein